MPDMREGVMSAEEIPEWYKKMTSNEVMLDIIPGQFEPLNMGDHDHILMHIAKKELETIKRREQYLLGFIERCENNIANPRTRLEAEDADRPLQKLYEHPFFEYLR
jgi:hypothetical protein